ncbi:SIS domain-containing protein [Streptomyces silvensis]|uniref:Sugar isomerase n=1 Tax=Streptomyces silvensis TaxID=1765722 RepID=A0A0W7X7I6_9ACTN|nr:SIS domain-containing protein [Streptomyces silvensis]KUF18921.1 sugar isomerase [Streptomyces silvensis]
MSLTSQEIASQPQCWDDVLDQLSAHAPALPAKGEHVAVIGCGTSWFMAQAYAHLREDSGHGPTDAFPASAARLHRRYDRIIALTRSGTTTEILTALASADPTTRITTITAVADSPAAKAAHDVVVLAGADEQSVVQTRYPTTQLILLLAHLGHSVEQARQDLVTALEAPLDPELLRAEQITFLGDGWHAGLAHEAALKVREAAARWTESYLVMEYRHGPIAVAGPGRAVWSLSPLPAELADRVEATGAHLRRAQLDPVAELVLAQRVAVRLAEDAGRDPDRPAHLTRSVVLA